jgi:pilus assembly protein CpaB
MIVRLLFLSMLLTGVALVGFIAFGMLPQQSPAIAAAPPPAAPVERVLVAARPMSAGMLLRSEDVRWSDWPLGRTPEGALIEGRTKDDAYRGSVTRRAFAAGEPILIGQIVAPGERGFLAAVLSPGTRAVSVAVDAVSATGGLIWPGDHVDLILTQNFDSEQGRSARKAVGETVLSDLRVIAIDQMLGEPAPNTAQGPPESRIPRTVTLEVSQAQGEAVAVAASIGKLSLALRSLAAGEEAPHAAPSTWADDVSPALRQRGQPRERATLTVYRGTKAEVVER